MIAFGQPELVHRMAHGGLPPFFLATSPPERDFQEWLDACRAKDAQALFRLEKRGPFARLFELLLADSGGSFEATRFARACAISRQTVMNYLEVLEATFVMHAVRPFASNASTEIVAAPRVYGFDTGFVLGGSRCASSGCRTWRRCCLIPLAIRPVAAHRSRHDRASRPPQYGPRRPLSRLA